MFSSRFIEGLKKNTQQEGAATAFNLQLAPVEIRKLTFFSYSQEQWHEFHLMYWRVQTGNLREIMISQGVNVSGWEYDVKERKYKHFTPEQCIAAIEKLAQPTSETTGG